MEKQTQKNGKMDSKAKKNQNSNRARANGDVKQVIENHPTSHYGKYVEKYIRKTKLNECHFEKLTDDHLIRLTTSMTSICFLGRPECKRCPLHGDTMYCPPAAAHSVLTERGYKRVEIFEGISVRKEYRKDTLMPTVISEMI